MILMVRDVLIDILTKLGRYPNVNNKERILFAPDHKISKNLIHLTKVYFTFNSFSGRVAITLFTAAAYSRFVLYFYELSS